MCLSCWPVKDIVLEEDDAPEQRRRQQMFQYVWNGQQWVPRVGNTLHNSLILRVSYPTPYPLLENPRKNLFLERDRLALRLPGLPNRTFSLQLNIISTVRESAQVLELQISPPRQQYHNITMSDEKGKKGKKTTISNEIPVRQHARTSGNSESTSYASAGTASDPSVPGPGVQNTLQYPSGNGNGGHALGGVNGPHPTFGQQHSLHQTGSINPQFQQNQAPQAGFFYQNSNRLPHHGAFQLHQHHNPYLINHTPPNLVSHIHTCQPYFNPYIVRTAFVPPPIHTMADYGNGAMPNTGQNFQPPVPDTTYGPIPHVYRPRFDSGVQAMPGTGPAFLPPQSAPCTCPYPAAPAPVLFTPPQVQPGIATAPMSIPMMSHQPQPIVVQGGQPMHGMPAMMPSQGIPAVMSAPGMPQPVSSVMGGYQPQMFPGNYAPGVSPPGMLPPDIMGIGRTQNEQTCDLLESMQKDNILEAQDIKPADDDPARMYMCRELDGNWTKRSRFTIDNLPCRWYITPWGGFYAVRLED
ncbi:hypothetical protein SCUP234_06165 [Seiridium cupressi]